MKPSFANDGMILYSVEGTTRPISEPLTNALHPLVSEHKEVRFAKWATAADINTPTLTAQKDLTDIDNVNGFPRANTSAAINFIYMGDRATTMHEASIWQVAGGLFDPIELAFPILLEGFTEQQAAQYEPRLRRDGFSELWARLSHGSVEERLGNARTAEEKALLYLTENNVSAACDALVSGKNFKLATLVSQLPGDHASRSLMEKQITAWCERNDWSEFPDTVRALYSIIAGQVCTIAGKTGPAENRVKEVCISEQFGLTWMQSFGLRLFFGGHASVLEAVEAYCNDLSDKKEKILPVPSWANQGEGEGREDPLMGLLRLSTKRGDLETLFDPKNVSGSAVNSRLAWQMATQLRAQGYCSSLPDEKLDQLTIGFAAELEAAGLFVTSTWVLLHLRHAGTRSTAVAELIQRNGGRIPDPGTTQPDYFRVLEAENKIPAELLWSAKALHARAELNDPWLQTQYLLNAQALDEAHDVICTTLGPKAIIEKDYKPLLDLLTRFPIQKPEGWVQGGAVFSDFARLMGFNTSRKFSREGSALAEKLKAGLAAMEGVERNMGLEEKVAMVEMDTVLKDEMRQMAIHGSGFEQDDEEMSDAKGEGMGSAFLRYREALGMVA
jgi:nuclear pore complex protein Nup98-Nup96